MAAKLVARQQSRSIQMGQARQLPSVGGVARAGIDLHMGCQKLSEPGAGNYHAGSHSFNQLDFLFFCQRVAVVYGLCETEEASVHSKDVLLLSICDLQERKEELSAYLNLKLLCFRETARKLRQRKVEALQQLQSDVSGLAKENQFLAEKLQNSIYKVSKLTLTKVKASLDHRAQVTVVPHVIH